MASLAGALFCSCSETSTPASMPSPLVASPTGVEDCLFASVSWSLWPSILVDLDRDSPVGGAVAGERGC
jgi:hypothetical protein